MIVNALDLLYLWMYKPRSRNICCSLVKKMSMDEVNAFIESQSVLKSERAITQLFADGLVGRSFSKPLAFYLEYYRDYLGDLEGMAERRCNGTGRMRRIITNLKELPRGRGRLNHAEEGLKPISGTSS
jgi:hypothetical protein